MTKKYTTTLKRINEVAQLAHIPLSGTNEAESLREAFDETLKTFENLKTIDTENVPQMHQVTGLENVLREDVVDEKRMFTQDQALAGAQHTHEGYFMVEEILAK